MSNYTDIKKMHEAEKNKDKKAKLKEMLECMEEASINRGLAPGDWKAIGAKK